MLAGSTAWSPTIACFAVSYGANYRGYDHGLHIGRGDCHLDNNNAIFQLKSHITSGGNGFGDWYAPQHAFLHHNILQVRWFGM